MNNKIFPSLIIILLTISSLSVSGLNINSLKQESLDIIQINNNYYDSSQEEILVRINISEKLFKIQKNIEIVSYNSNKWIDIIIPRSELLELAKRNIEYTILINNLNDYSKSNINDYHSLSEMEDFLIEIGNRYPEITSLYSIGKTYEDREIWCLEITDNPGVDEDEPGVFYIGLHHAREWPSLEVCLYIADMLTSNYGLDSEITDIVDNRRIWLVPCVNPDGYYFCHDLGNDWRKNRHYFPDTDTYGVDLNRNYEGSSNGDSWGIWGSLGTASVTHNPTYSTYCGPYPMSELESQAVRDIFINNDIHAAISWHTYGELVLWPWSYSEEDYSPDHNYMSQIGQEIASRITKQDGSGTYEPAKGSDLYPTTGDTTDWAYGYSRYILGRPTFAYTIEACTQYHPPANLLNQILKENYDGALYLLKEAENIKNNVIPPVIPPKINEMTSDADGNFTISWQIKNQKISPDFFQLDELKGLSIITDEAEFDDSLWYLDGFSLSNSRFHSEIHSYKTRSENADVSSMTTIYPIPIVDEMKLSFWCWYNIETEWDYGFVEVSQNNRSYDILDKFTGSSNGWEYKEYDLSEYKNESVFIRFRYTTDRNTIGEGLYIDDISPVADFDIINTISNSIVDNYYQILVNEDDKYFYRVRGYDDGQGWGDFSTIEQINVGIEENSPPNIPTISGPSSGKIRTDYSYSTVTSDSNGDQISYLIDWGDGSFSGWIGPYNSGQMVSTSHKWNEIGDYSIRVKARDSHFYESQWADPLVINMPKTKDLYNIPLLRLIENHVIIDLISKLLYRFSWKY